MVYKVDGNPQLDSRDWSMYSNILEARFSQLIKSPIICEKQINFGVEHLFFTKSICLNSPGPESKR